jgi:hypothetical protein
MVKNKRGWIRIVEAFVAILLIAGILLLVVGQDYLQKEDISVGIYKEEILILRQIQLNENLRSDLLTVSTLPIEWNDFSTNGLSNVESHIDSKVPSNLECVAKLCAIDILCDLTTTLDKDIYAQQVIISANLNDYKPRQLKLFCWLK